tara:strand:- start:3295 stop:11565 length:8271 start_codon:yes stop_codon:yes gene_type:complete
MSVSRINQTKKDYVKGFRDYLIKTKPGAYFEQGLADSTDDFIAAKILNLPDDAFLPEPSASTNNQESQGTDNIEVTKQSNDLTKAVNGDASTDAGQGSTITDNNLVATDKQKTHGVRVGEYLDLSKPADALLNQALKNSVESEDVKLQDGSIVNTATGDKFIQSGDGEVTKSHKINDIEYDKIQKDLKDGKIDTTNELEEYDFSTPVDTSDSKANRQALVDANEPLVDTKVDSLIKHPNGEPMKVKLAETAARRFENAYDELAEMGINLMIASHKTGHDSQMAQHQEYLKAVEEGNEKYPFVAHPDDSFHTIGYAVDLAQPLQYGMYQNIETIAEVMKRHGWNHHSDEWWHFSVDHLDEKFKKKPKAEEVATGDLIEDDDFSSSMKLVIDTPVNENEDLLWQSYDGKVKLLKEGVSFSEILDNSYTGNSINIANLVNSWDIPESGEVNTSQFMTIVANNIDEEALEKAREDFFHDYRFNKRIQLFSKEGDATASQAEWLSRYGLKPNELMSKSQYDMIMSDWDTENSIAEKGMWGVSFPRVWAQAFENSMTGHIYLPSVGMFVEGYGKPGDAGRRDALGVSLGFVPEMNQWEKAMVGALQFIMPLDMIALRRSGAAGAWFYAKAINTRLGGFLRNFIINNGIATANKASGMANRVMHHFLQKNMGTNLARSTQMFGIYDGSLAMLRHYLNEGTPVPRYDQYGNPVMKDIINKETGEVLGQEQVYDKKGVLSDVMSAYLHGNMFGAIMFGVGHAVGTPMKGAWKNATANSTLPELALKSGESVVGFIPEYLAFTGLSYSDAIKQEKEGLKLYYRQQGEIKTDAEIDAMIDKGEIFERSAKETFAFLLAIKAVHSPFEATKHFLDPEGQQKLYKQYYEKFHREAEKNPQNIPELAINLAKEMGIKDVNVAKMMQSRLTNVPRDEAGNRIWDKELYPEKEVRDLAKQLGIKDQKERTYEELCEIVYEVNSKIMAENIDGTHRNKEIDEVANRAERTELEKENFKNELDKKLDNETKSPEEVAKEIVQLAFEFGATPLETSVIVKKNGRDNVKDIQKQIEKEARKQQKESFPPSMVKEKTEKADKKDSEVPTDKKTKKKVKKKTKKEPEVKAASRKKKKRVNEITKEVDKKLDEIDARLSSANTIKEEKSVKNFAEIKKPHGAKDIVFHEIDKDGNVKEIVVDKYKGKQTFKTESEYNEWVDGIPIRPHMTPTIIKRKLKDGRIQAQAWEKLTPKSKLPKQPRVTKLKGKQKADLDRDAMSARKLSEEIKNDPVLLLRDPNNKPMETMDKVATIIEQIQEMEGARSVLAHNLTELLGDRLIIVGNQERLSSRIWKDKDANDILALRNSIKALDSRMTQDRRQINRLLSNKALNDQIRKKMLVIAKNKISLKATEGGFIDWSGRDRPEKINKDHLEFLRQDLMLDMAEYLNRVSRITEKPLNKLSATEISKVLSEEYGLPKKTTFEFFKHNKAKMLELMEQHKFALLNDALENAEIDPTYTPEMSEGSKPKTTFKTLDKIFPAIGKKLKENMVDTIQVIRQHEGQIPAEVQNQVRTNKDAVKKIKKEMPEVHQIWEQWYNYQQGGTAEPSFISPDILKRLNELGIYARSVSELQFSKLYDFEVGTPEFLTQQNVAVAHAKAVEALFSEYGRGLQTGGSKELVDPKLISKMLNHWNIKYNATTAEYMMDEVAGVTKKDPKLRGGQGLAYVGAKVTGIGLDLFRANLLASWSSSVKTFLGNSFSVGSEYFIDGLFWLPDRAYQKFHQIALNKIKESGLPDNQMWDEYVKLQNDYFATGRMSAAWAYQQQGKVKFKKTIADLAKETLSIMTETGDFALFNPNYGKDLQSNLLGINSNTGIKLVDGSINFIGKAIRSPINLMGAWDNAWKTPVYLRELHMLAYHEAISEWSRLYGQHPTDKKAASRKPELGNKEHATQMDNIVSEILKGGPTGPYGIIWNRIHATAQRYADKSVFQAPFTTKWGKALQQVRSSDKDNYFSILGGNMVQYMLPFVVTGVNGIKMAHEYQPTGLATLSYWADLTYRYETQAFGWTHRPTSPIYQIVEPMYGAHHRPLVNRMWRKRMAKMVAGTVGSGLALNYILDQDEDDQKVNYMTANYYGVGQGRFTKKDQEDRLLRESMGEQSDAVRLDKMNPSAQEFFGIDPDAKTFTLNSADPLSTILQLSDGNRILWKNSKKGALSILRKAGLDDLANKGEAVVNARNNPDTEEDFTDALSEFYLAYLQAFENNPAMQQLDKAFEMYTREDGDKILDVLLGRIGSSMMMNPTLYRQLVGVAEGIKYKPNAKQTYDENGLKFVTMADMIDSNNPLYNHILNDKPTLIADDYLTMKKAKQTIPPSGMIPGSEQPTDTKRNIPFPYTTKEGGVPVAYQLLNENIHQMKHHDKYPLLNIFGYPIPAMGQERIFGAGITDATMDEVGMTLGKEFLFLKEMDAVMPTMIPEMTIGSELFTKNELDSVFGSNKISKYSATIKLDEKMQFVRNKLIGDLFKEKMWEIVGKDTDVPTGLQRAYRDHRNKMDAIKEKQSYMEKDSEEWIKANQEYVTYLNDVTGVWKNVANWVKDAVDLSIFGEELHNVAMWNDHTKQWLDNHEMMKMELRGYYPNKSDEEIDKVFNTFWEVIHEEKYAGKDRNILHNEFFRKWKQHNKIDSDHHLDKKNLEDLIFNLNWGEDIVIDRTMIDTKDGMKSRGDLIFSDRSKDQKDTFENEPKDIVFEATDEEIDASDLYFNIDGNNESDIAKLNNYLNTLKD